MKNGTHSSKLVMVDGSGNEIGSQDDLNDSATDYAYRVEADAAEENSSVRTTLIVVMVLTIACTTAAIAAGSYGVWLARHQAARQTLTDVNDILRTCQSRMRQLEADVQKIPGQNT